MSARNDKNPDNNNWLIGGGIYLTLLLLVIALDPTIGIALFVFSALVALAAAGVMYLRPRYFSGRSTRVQSFAARLRERLESCQRQEDKFRDEANNIRESIGRLRDDLDKSTTAPAEELAKGEKLITALKAEFDLRHTKALFFADCATRLKQMLDRHQLSESLAARRKELDEMRATNFDDEAAVEETRYHLEQDGIQLETIAELTKDVGEYFKTEQAEELRLRLEKLRKNILGGAQPTEEKKS